VRGFFFVARTLNKRPRHSLPKVRAALSPQERGEGTNAGAAFSDTVVIGYKYRVGAPWRDLPESGPLPTATCDHLELNAAVERIARIVLAAADHILG
jgi:hypothetical protein